MRAEEEGWSKAEMYRLGKLVRLLWMKKGDELSEACRQEEMELEKGGAAADGSRGSEPDSDDERVNRFRERWIAQWFDACGPYDCITNKLSMQFTHHPAPPKACPCTTLQIHSVKVDGLSGGLQWPLDVFGMVAVRDRVDRNRNLLFYQPREKCQTLTEKDSYLVLTGPCRAVVVGDSSEDPVIIEVMLKVKGITESEDKYLSYLAEPLINSSGLACSSFDSNHTSKLSTLKLTLSEIDSSVESTIFVRVIEGSWPHGYHGRFSANPSDKKVFLLEFGADNVRISGDGNVELSRRVVSVSVKSLLDISCSASTGDGSTAVTTSVKFKPQETGRNYATVQLCSCKLEILVAWSLISTEPESLMDC